MRRAERILISADKERKKCPGRNLGMLKFEPDGVGKLLEVFNSIMRGSGFVFGALKTEMQ